MAVAGAVAVAVAVALPVEQTADSSEVTLLSYEFTCSKALCFGLRSLCPLSEPPCGLDKIPIGVLDTGPLLPDRPQEPHQLAFILVIF